MVSETLQINIDRSEVWVTWPSLAEVPGQKVDVLFGHRGHALAVEFDDRWSIVSHGFLLQLTAGRIDRPDEVRHRTRFH